MNQFIQIEKKKDENYRKMKIISEGKMVYVVSFFFFFFYLNSSYQLLFFHGTYPILPS
jgi:hypothetical protein